MSVKRIKWKDSLAFMTVTIKATLNDAYTGDKAYWWQVLDQYRRTAQTWWLLIAERKQLPRDIRTLIQQYVACRNI